jgi:DegV family protein with EDD domain
MTVKIITDSASDLTPEIASKWGITVMPLYIKFGSETYRDGVDLTTDEFYHRLSHDRILPTTSAPSAGDFVEIYDKLAQETDEILAIMLSSKYSVTYDVALKGRELKNSQARVEVIDSYTAIMGLGLICISAAEAAESGASLDECIDIVHSNMPRTHVRMAFDTLEYLKRGGRIGTAEALVGSMLKVNPILTIKDGSTEAVARTRSRSRAIEHLYNFASSFSNIEKLAIEDATTPDEAEIMADKLSSRFPRERIIRTKVSPVVGTHVGPHVLSVVVQGE